MTDKQKALEAFWVALARCWDDNAFTDHQDNGMNVAVGALLAAIDAEKQPEPESIVARLRTGSFESVQPNERAIRDIERLAERLRAYKEPREKLAHEIDGK